MPTLSHTHCTMLGFLILRMSAVSENESCTVQGAHSGKSESGVACGAATAAAFFFFLGFFFESLKLMSG